MTEWMETENTLDQVKREISLNLDQWEKLKDALDYYERGAREFLPYKDGEELRKEFILPVYMQMPDEIF